VCACGGKSYPSACAAHFAGFDVTASRSCIPGNGAAGANCGVDGDCMTGLKCCRIGGTPGSPLACYQVTGGQCPLFP
jgi:hypothetical protein